MNIAIIGHNRTMAFVSASIKQHYKEIETIEIEFIDADLKESTLEYLKVQLPIFDGIVFTGPKPYEIINSALSITIPQTFIRYDRSILLQTMLEATIKEDYDIRSFSCDSYNKDMILDLYDCIGMNRSEIDIYIAPKNIKGNNLVLEYTTFHKEKYNKGLASFCMTGISMVYEKLQAEKIPCLLMHPTSEAIHNGIRQLIAQINAIKSTESQIVVLSMEIDLPNKYNLIHDNDYQLMLEKTRVSEQVYKFAKRIQAAVIEVGSHNYMMFSTRQILESVTEYLISIPILSDVSSNTAHTLSVGIGYGKTAREAKYNAALGLNSALTKGGNQAFSVKEGKISAPIYPDTNLEQEGASISDPLFKVIAEATGISINSVYKLHCIKEKTNEIGVTSRELAEEFGNSRRSMNRIIEKLIIAGYAQIEGKRMMSDTGRPTRVIKLKW